MYIHVKNVRNSEENKKKKMGENKKKGKIIYFKDQEKCIRLWENWDNRERHSKANCNLKTGKLISKSSHKFWAISNKLPRWLMGSPDFDIFILSPNVSQCNSRTQITGPETRSRWDVMDCSIQDKKVNYLMDSLRLKLLNLWIMSGANLLLKWYRCL